MQIKRIKSITKINNNSKKYDIEVNNTHIFFANNILVHNSNFQVAIDNSGEVKYGKRSSFLGNDSNFYNFQEALKEDCVKKFIEDMKKYCYGHCVNLVIFGEIFGGNIQKEVKYGKDIKIRFYDIYDMDEEIYWSPSDTFKVLLKYNVSVPIIATDVSFEDAMKWENDFISTLTPEDYDGKEPNICEGIVIKPQYKTYKYMDSYFIIKSKNDKFKEKSKSGSGKVTLDFIEKLKSEGVSDEVIKLIDIANEYVNENRLNNVISHYGPLTDMKQISEYMKYFMEDYQNDFVKDNPNIFEKIKNDYPDDFKKLSKLIFSTANSNCVILIKNHIMNKEN